MDLNGVGLIGAIVVGGIAGWLAEQFMRSNMGLLMNIVLGIIGAAALNFVLSLAGVYTGTGLLVYLVVGFIGACILIAIARAVRR
ncbi:GlsB/YeaQ/YmgE family stress response membrane protein [Rhizobium sp. SG2393]|uniref:GlsB/YeaQ/YmgE family stress response membrane protein n=1 Tax=Rhizobium sp. SG2393 TaxID=3276279 RepID=UPI0036705C49